MVRMAGKPPMRPFSIPSMPAIPVNGVLRKTMNSIPNWQKALYMMPALLMLPLKPVSISRS